MRENSKKELESKFPFVSFNLLEERLSYLHDPLGPTILLYPHSGNERLSLNKATPVVSAVREIGITKRLNVILLVDRYGGVTVSYTVTEKGTVTIPAEIRKKYKLGKGSRIKFVETDEGVLLVPAIPLEHLFGADRDRKETVYRMIKELQEDRRKETSE